MRNLVIISLLALVAACSGQHAPGKPVAAPAEGAQPATAAAAPAFPGGVDFNLPSQVRSDRTYKTKAGETRRRVVYELLEASPDQSQAAVAGVLARAGYEAGTASPGKKGKTRVKYSKQGAPTITAAFYPGLAKKPANPSAMSMVAFSWRVKADARD